MAVSGNSRSVVMGSSCGYLDVHAESTMSGQLLTIRSSPADSFLTNQRSPARSRKNGVRTVSPMLNVLPEPDYWEIP